MFEPIFAKSGLKEPLPSNADELYDIGKALIPEILFVALISADGCVVNNLATTGL